jgi:hypothetical protein
VQREISYNPQELVHPEILNGKQRWISNEVKEIAHKLQYGDPVLGWEGDPRLALYLEDRGSWVVERLENDGQYRTVCRSRQGLPLDDRLILRLMEHDHRRGFDPVAFNTDDNSVDTAAEDRMREMHERVYHAAAKDLGIV